MTVWEFFHYCEERGLLDHKITYSAMADGSGRQIEKDLEECDIEEHEWEILITDHSGD